MEQANHEVSVKNFSVNALRPVRPEGTEGDRVSPHSGSGVSALFI